MITQQFVDSIDIQEALTKTAEMPAKIRNISKAVLGLERSRAVIRRSISKTRREVRTVQYSLMSALMAFEFNDTPLGFGFIVLTIWLTFRVKINRRKNT